MRPKISIVTISYNQKKYLRKCLDSVLCQKDEGVEYIVVDPGSTDGSRDLIESYGDHIDHVIFEPDEGPADGLNKGFQWASGDIGYFINADDFLLPGAIGRMRRIWCDFPDLDILLGGAWIVDGCDAPLRELRPNRVTIQGLILGQSLVIQQGLSFRMALFREIGGFNRENCSCWDYELLCEMLDRSPRVMRTDEKFGVFRLHDASLTGGGHGEIHDQRYLNDVTRIRTERGFSAQSSGSSRFLKFIKDPRWTINFIADRCLVARRKRRWNADATGKESRE